MRRLGQHFLSDPKILGRIVDALDPVPGETVLEIGPGKGTLTDALLGRGLHVVAIEKDKHLAGALVRANLTVIAGDALRLDWPRAPKIVGNIPYYITSPLIDKALTPPLPERVVFLVQEEVADRIAAKPGSKTYGALSVGVQAVARVEKLFTVAAGAFRPPPKVRSALIRLTPRVEPLVTTDEIGSLRAFVTACFSKRRKQLKNAVPGLSEAELRSLGFDVAVRPERLPPQAFVQLLRASRGAEQ
ncbi:MAG TPA: 16S rRNA (adenine(1518)-N(6)/adenine(1519)-N(6))-dimethyltransferase RsmA [Gemmatimonadales bacterium]|nr:16S rRNA (adenine(1518)-N(6)/adenine(1519)-N(6))-dimethyltransferase RsmA [Gemmatimonadales bacterium]